MLTQRAFAVVFLLGYIALAGILVTDGWGLALWAACVPVVVLEVAALWTGRETYSEKVQAWARPAAWRRVVVVVVLAALAAHWAL